MIGAHIALEFIRFVLGGKTKAPTIRPKGKPYIERTHIVTGETVGQITARLDKAQNEWTRERKVVTTFNPPIPETKFGLGVPEKPITRRGIPLR